MKDFEDFWLFASSIVGVLLALLLSCSYPHRFDPQRQQHQQVNKRAKQ
jgi:hypothetical protein